MLLSATLTCWIIAALSVCVRFFFFWLTLGLDLSAHSIVDYESAHSVMGRVLTPQWRILRQVGPLSCFLLCGHMFSSVALDKVPVSFLHTIKALSPLFTVAIYRFYFNTHYSPQIYISLIPLTLGVMLACSFELTFTMFGLVCAVSSTVVFVVQNIYSKSLFRDRKLDKLNTLFYSSTIACLLMTPIWLMLEGDKVAELLFGSVDLEDDERRPLSHLLELVFLNGSTHFAQNVFAFSVLHSVSPVTYSVASLLKRIVVIVASIVWFRQYVSVTQIVGVAMTMCGLAMYQQARIYGGGEKELATSMNNDELITQFKRTSPPISNEEMHRKFPPALSSSYSVGSGDLTSG